MDVVFILDTLGKLLAALPTTLALWAVSISAGAVLALGIVWMRVSGNRALSAVARGYVLHLPRHAAADPAVPGLLRARPVPCDPP